ncbi:MAG: hypothetical protein GX444_13710 [Myxococcales bacterium]|nr:hypothetical protein [Myxococcales bacterium]
MRVWRAVFFILGLIAIAGQAGAAVPVSSDTIALGVGQTVFRHRFIAAVPAVATGDYFRPAVAYPEIAVDPKYKHALSFQMTPMFPPRRVAVPSFGPLILYSDDLDCLVFSPLDHFFISLVSFENGRIRYGIEGEIAAIPAGFTHRFLLVEGKGINATIEAWGEAIRRDRGVARRDRYADLSLSHLGYWTDNGAAYYYNTEPGMTPEETLLAVKREADDLKIPYGYLQIDSWFYYKAASWPLPGGMQRWEPRPEVFPRGLDGLHRLTGLPLITHNRWFAKENAYRDRCAFVDDRRMALPTDRCVFDEFAANAKKWGVVTYEQDWLINQFWGNAWLRDGVDHAERYLANLAGAMADRGLTMQICMSGTAHVMAAVDHPNITTVRSSIDYFPGISKESYWPQFHINNMVVWAIGIWPYKDTFQTAEKHGWAEALISSLSGGPVGPSDFLGKTNTDILARTCRTDGLLLKPDKPATPIDAMFLPHRRPFTVATYSDRGAQGRWVYLSAFLIERYHPDRRPADRIWPYVSYDFSDPSLFFYFPDEVDDWRVDPRRDLAIAGPAVLYDWKTRRAEIVSGPFQMPPIRRLYDFNHFLLAPILENGMALLGETDKFVPLADKRFTEIKTEPDALEITLAGQPGEVVTLRAFDARAGRIIGPRNFTIGTDGTAIARLTR